MSHVISQPARKVDAAPSHRPAAVVASSAILGLLAIGCAQGGIAMVADPNRPLGMSVEYLEGTPVHDYLLPGVFLLALGAASLLTTIGLLLNWRWGWASPIERRVGYRWPWIGAVATGAVLLAFEIAELFVVPFHPIMHPLLIAVALVTIGLALTPGSRAYLRAE
jgi:hypothetical protein